ncbi:hypothetical protein N9W79_01455, partial [bacterium]|nr:hypothetical protein [bacterium]
VVIKSKSTRKISAIDDFVSAFDAWFSNLLESGESNIIDIISSHLDRDDDLLAGVFKSLLDFRETTGGVRVTPSSSRIEGKMFKFQLLNVVKKINSAMEDDIYLVLDNFNCADKITVDFLEFYFTNYVSSNLKCILFYKEFKSDDHNNSLDLIKEIERNATNVEKITIPPFEEDEISDFLEVLIPPHLKNAYNPTDMLEITKGNPLFVKSLVLAKDQFKEIRKGSFDSLFQTLLGPKEENESLYYALMVLATFGKPMALETVVDLCHVEQKDEFDYSILKIISMGLISTRDGKLWFSHDKYADLTNASIDEEISLKLNRKIASYLIEHRYDQDSDSNLIFDIAHHSSESFELMDSISESTKLSSICFAAGVKCREIGALEDALFFTKRAIDAIELSSKQGSKVDPQFKYVVNFEHAYLLKETNETELAIKAFKKLLHMTSGERERLEVELELIKVFSSQEDKAEFVDLIDMILERYHLNKISAPESLDVLSVVNRINQNLLGRSISQIKTGKFSPDEKEHIFQEILSYVVKSYLFVDHRVVTWAGLLIMERTLKLGQSKLAVIGVISYAHYLNAFLKDFSGAKGFKDLADEMHGSKNDSTTSWARVLSSVLLSTLNNDYAEFKRKNEVEMKSALQSDQFEHYEFLTILSLLNDLCYSERPSFLKDRIYILDKISEKHGSKNHLLSSYLELVSGHVSRLLGEENKVNKSIKNSDVLTDKDEKKSPFLVCLNEIFGLKEKHFLGRTYESDLEDDFDEKSVVGGTILEAEFLFWSFIYDTNCAITENLKGVAEPSRHSRKLALLSRNSISTFHVSSQRIKLSYLIDNFLSSKYSSSALKDIGDQVKINIDKYSYIELALIYEFLAGLYKNAKFYDVAKDYFELSIFYAKESGIGKYQEKLVNLMDNTKSTTLKVPTIDAKNQGEVDQVDQVDQVGQKEEASHVENSNKEEGGAVNEETTETTPEKLMEVRQEILRNLFDIDSILMEENENVWGCLERFEEITKLLLKPFRITFEWNHHGDREPLDTSLADKLPQIFKVLRELTDFEDSSISFDTIVDPISGSGNLILSFKIKIDDSSKAELKSVLKSALEETDKTKITPEMTNEESEEVCFEFQVSTGASEEKKKLTS